jgi:type III secretion protein J
MPTVLRAAVALLVLPACGGEELLHGLDDAQAREVLAALADAGVEAREARGDGPDALASVTVPHPDAPRARRLLVAEGLPRARAPGLEEVFGKPALVPTPVEERARFLLALQGELARTLEVLDGVVAARVHLALPVPDPLRPEPARPARGAVLLRCRPGAKQRLDGLADGIRQIVVGSADGLAPAAVSVVVVEAPAPQSGAGAERRLPRVALWLGAGAMALAAGAVGRHALRQRAGRPS